MKGRWLMVAMFATACGAGTAGESAGGGPPPTDPHPECAADAGSGPAAMTLSPAQRQRAISLVMADPVVKELTGVRPDPMLIGAWVGTCAADQPERLFGAPVVLLLDNPQDASWDDTHVSCANGVAQLVRTRDTWHDVRSLLAEVLLRTGAVIWQPPPPVPPPTVAPPSQQ